ncbi:MAG: hypothetical protein AAFQ62_04590 [Pseudomonadota bacterium]
MTASNRISVNVEDGFLPHFSPVFLDQYGPVFVHAVSDHFTLKLAEIMNRAGDLVGASDVARFSDDESVELLRDLMGLLGERKKQVLSEACGSAPVGTISEVVTDRLGEGVFEAWLESFRSRSPSRCRAILETARGGDDL